MRHVLKLFILLFLATSFTLQAGSFYSERHQLNWQAPDSLFMPGYETLWRLHFEGAHYDEMAIDHPWFVVRMSLYDASLQLEVQLDSVVTEPLPDVQLFALNGFVPQGDFITSWSIGQARNDVIGKIMVMPLRLNAETGLIERLVSFRLNIELGDAPFILKNGPQFSVENSVLATGNWYKISVNTSGIHRITAADLQQMGINLAAVDPRNIRIYGNGGGMLPEPNIAFRHEDLVENPIIVTGEADGRFDPGDQILFYARAPVTWRFNQISNYFDHQNNHYEDHTYFFLTTDLGPGKRLQVAESPNANVTHVINDFLDYQVHESDLLNLINMGRTWYGEVFDFNLLQHFDFNFPNIVTNRQARVNSNVASRNFNPASFQWLAYDQVKATASIGTVPPNHYEFAKPANAIFEFDPVSDNIKISLRYNRTANSSRGWLDYIAVNAWRQLRFAGPQMLFRNPETWATQRINEFRLANASAQLSVWEVTNPVEPKLVNTSFSGGQLTWKADGESLREFVAFDGTSYHAVEFVGQVPNQNLHSVKNIDYLIISHDEFLDQAERLANIHRSASNMEVYVTTPQLIYNEFSSGGQDISGMRDFVRRLYFNSDPGKQIRYLLLFGDASFDYKDRITGNTNFVPTWQSDGSLHTVYSIATDDFFGYLDEGEGGSTSNLLDIGVGRFPVSTPLQAQQAVDKVLAYMRKDVRTMGPWRNYITFVADDGDANLHLRDAEILSTLVGNTSPALNIDKIYLDAYPQVATSGGQKAPEVNQAINRRMERGTLVMNYSGHGGEVGWAEERILEIADIQGWRNIDKLPVFITATCEFSRYDDPDRTSAGEMVFLNPRGGAIAMFTTARATFASANRILNEAVFNNNMFSRQNGEYPRFGDIIRRAKTMGNANDRKFVLLGDPALRLAYPTERVETTHINGRAVGSRMDTISALDQVTIAGRITNDQGQFLSNFNGVLHATVFDKKSQLMTKGDESGFPETFTMRKSIIYQGLASVNNGLFEFSFIVPKDIAYNFGEGRISYYATNYDVDGHGMFESFVVGGFNENAVADDNGPEIRLFINDTTFKNGDITDERPVLLAFVSDESGINTTGAGIGHDIVANITGETDVHAILNDFYTADLDKSTSGSIVYPFFNLGEGEHTLSLKVWDVFNNSNEASIEFVVVNSGQMAIDNLMNYPNPFVNETYFVFEHNQAGRTLEIEIQVFNLNGNMVKTIRESINPVSYRSNPIRWDGSTDGGYPIAKGLYVYRLLVTNEQGEKDELRSKLIVHR